MNGPDRETAMTVAYRTSDDQEVKLSPAIVRNYLVSGGGDVSDQEVVMFLKLCQMQRLNPFLREAYIIKFGNNPATICTGKEALTKRAEAHPQGDGWKAGVVIERSGEIVYRDGSMVLDGETLCGGWAEAFRKDRKHAFRSEVSFDEYVGRKRDGSINRQWSSKPGTMVRKVALMQALREAFPATLGGMVDAAEVGVDEDRVDARGPAEQAVLQKVQDRANAEPEAPHRGDEQTSDMDPETERHVLAAQYMKLLANHRESAEHVLGSAIHDNPNHLGIDDLVARIEAVEAQITEDAS